MMATHQEHNFKQLPLWAIQFVSDCLGPTGLFLGHLFTNSSMTAAPRLRYHNMCTDSPLTLARVSCWVNTYFHKLPVHSSNFMSWSDGSPVPPVHCRYDDEVPSACKPCQPDQLLARYCTHRIYACARSSESSSS